MKEERRERIYYFDPRSLVELLNWAIAPPGRHAAMPMRVYIPADAKAVAVYDDPPRRAIAVVFAHESFDLVTPELGPPTFDAMDECRVVVKGEETMEPITAEMEKSGGPAYPLSMTVDGTVLFEAGISVHDWFAGSRAAGVYALSQGEARTHGEMAKLLGEGYTQAQMFTLFCREFADAMIAERKKK